MFSTVVYPAVVPICPLLPRGTPVTVETRKRALKKAFRRFFLRETIIKEMEKCSEEDLPLWEDYLGLFLPAGVFYGPDPRGEFPLGIWYNDSEETEKIWGDPHYIRKSAKVLTDYTRTVKKFVLLYPEKDIKGEISGGGKILEDGTYHLEWLRSCLWDKTGSYGD